MSCTRVAAELRALRISVHGSVLGPSDAGYNDARRISDAAVDRRPLAIVQVAGPGDVAAALTFARERGLSVSVRGGGYGLGDHAVSGDVVIDLAALHGVQVDPEARTAIVRGGTRWGEVDAATTAYGLAVPGARLTRIGAAGLTLSGGEGWLSGAHGLTADNLISAELVTADGRLVQAARNCHPELLWALRGGGANFGVVTSLTFRLHEVANRVIGGLVLFGVGAAPQVLGTLAELHRAGRDEFAPAAVFMCAPPARFVPGDAVGRPVLAVVPAWLGDPAEGERFLAPLRALRPLAESTRLMPYVVLQSLLDSGMPSGLRRRWTSARHEALSSATIDDLIDAALGTPGPGVQIVLTHVGGAVSRVAADATAYRHRQRGWLLRPIAQWPQADDDERHERWLAETGARITHSTPDGPTARLQAVKTAWDPDDVFRHCENHVPPLVEGASR
jgi:FAD/FMN-containing dehydrogenase